MTIDTAHLSQEYRAALSAFVVDASDVRRGIELLHHSWYRVKNAASRCTTNPLEGVTFFDVLEAVDTSRISGEPLVLPEPIKSRAGR